MYTANRMLCSTKMQMHRQHAFDIDVCLLKCVYSAGRRARARSFALLYMCSRASALTSSLCFILNPTRDFDANFNKHYCVYEHVCLCVCVCVCVHELKSVFSQYMKYTHSLTKYPLGLTRSSICACKYIQLYLIIHFDDVKECRNFEIAICE